MPSSAAAAEPRPNILWLIAEDMSPDAVGCYGGVQVWTPNLDKMAADGVRYTKAFTTAPVCSPSRSARLLLLLRRCPRQQGRSPCWRGGQASKPSLNE
jgi:hypothetical protein